ncbi:hypothetical protein RJ639_008277 [Escallonia herrerae]|uniref:C2H2-type domain-containing protein n=1 Tax=Escallonia herrerae TaxID=1293975 RepID=A0AA89AS75_9ASTE|nr:hypothetical protein RJ639_008277 [Escallonia herrerae]
MDVMENQEEFSGSTDHAHQIVKGKRTKRQRPSSPFGVAMTSSSSYGGGGSGGGGGDGEGGGAYFSLPSPTTSDDISAGTDEDEDMANCLILLAQSGRQEKTKVERYECRTCNRSFASFQALGGHRASHKKPKGMQEERSCNDQQNHSPKAAPCPKKAMMPPSKIAEEEVQGKFYKMSPPLSLQTPNRPKVHECSICGAHFSSGQALGGHMRRHRINNANSRIAMSMERSNTDESPPRASFEKARNILQLDLNLPAPEEDHRDSRFQFVFSTPALVGCHY